MSCQNEYGVKRRTHLSKPLAFAFIMLASLIPSPAQAMTLQESVRLALEKNFDIRISENIKKRAKHDLDIANAEYLPEISIGTTRRFSVQATTDSALSDSQNEIENSQASVSQRLNTGGRVTVSTALDRRENNNQFKTLNPSYNADVVIRIVQPLLSGYGPSVAKARRRLSRLELERREHDFQATVVQVITDTELAYHQVAFTREQLDARIAALRLAEQLLEENKAKRETGIATSLDVLQAEVGVANARDRLLRAEKSHEDAKDRLFTIIGISPADTDLAVESLEIQTLEVPEVGTVFDKAIGNAPQYLSLLSARAQREIELKRAKRNRLPSLNLNGAYALTGLEGSLKSAYDQVPTRDSYNWQLNLSLDMPWMLVEKKADYQKALLQLDNEEARLERQKHVIMRDARFAVRNVKTAIEGLDISRLETRLSEEEFELEKSKFDAGLSTGREVLEAQQRMDESRVEELRLKVALLDAYSELREIDGSAFRRYGIEID